jgi:hypothetical protein
MVVVKVMQKKGYCKKKEKKDEEAVC